MSCYLHSLSSAQLSSHTHTHTHTYIHAYMHIHARPQKYTHTHTPTHMHTHIHIHNTLAGRRGGRSVGCPGRAAGSGPTSNACRLCEAPPDSGMCTSVCMGGNACVFGLGWVKRTPITDRCLSALKSLLCIGLRLALIDATHLPSGATLTLRHALHASNWEGC